MISCVCLDSLSCIYSRDIYFSSSLLKVGHAFVIISSNSFHYYGNPSVMGSLMTFYVFNVFFDSLCFLMTVYRFNKVVSL